MIKPNNPLIIMDFHYSEYFCDREEEAGKIIYTGSFIAKYNSLVKKEIVYKTKKRLYHL